MDDMNQKKNGKGAPNILQSVDDPIADDVRTESAGASALPIPDFVLVYDLRDDKYSDYRRAFEKAMLEEGLCLDYETYRGVVFMKVTAPFARLCKEAERVRLEMSLRGCEILNPTRSCLSWAQKLFMTDDEVDFVSAPFQCDKLHLYEGYENQTTFFRSSVRGFLVHHTLLNLDISKRLAAIIEKKAHSNNKADAEENSYVQRAKEDVVNRIGLPYLLMNGAYTDAFVIHDPSAEDPYYANIKHKTMEQQMQSLHLVQDSRADLDRTWTKFFKFQPLWKIRNYFGEKIAFYFAWQGTLITLLWMPAILGVAVFGYGVAFTIGTTPRKLCTNEIVNLTDPRNNTCTVWAAVKYISEDALDVVNRSFDNTYTPFFSLVICLWGALFLEIWKRNLATLSYQWDVDTFREIEPDRPEFIGTVKQMDPITKKFIWTYPFSQQVRKFLVSGLVVFMSVCIVFVSVTTVILFKVSMKIVFNCTEAEDGNIDMSKASKGGIPVCLIMTTVLPSVFNGISILSFGYVYTRVADRLTRWENHRTQTDYNNSLIIKLFAFQFVNTYSSLFYIAFFRPSSHAIQEGGIFNLGPQYTDTCDRGGCMSLLSFQVLILMLFKPFPKFFMDIALPFLKRQFYKVKSAMQGYSGSVMHAVAAAGVIMPDHYVQREYHKPITGDFTLAEYSEKIIQFGYIMMFAASFPLAPLLALIMNLFDLRVDARRLLWFNRRPVAFMAGDIGMWFPIMRFVTLCGVVSNAFIIAYTSSFCDYFFPDLQSTPQEREVRLFVVIVFEHVVLVCMYLIGVMIPDIPEGIRLAQRRERYEVSKLLEEANSTSSLAQPSKADPAAVLEDADRKPTKVDDVDPPSHVSRESEKSERSHSPFVTSNSNPDLLDAMPSVKQRRSAMVMMSHAMANRSVATASELRLVTGSYGSSSNVENLTQHQQSPALNGEIRESKRSVSSTAGNGTPPCKETNTDDLGLIPNTIGSPPRKVSS